MVLTVVNPSAGRGRAGRLVPEMERALRTLGIEHRTVVSEGPGHPERAAREAAASGARAVVAVGGDGLVGACAGGIVGTRTALAVVPAGSGNDFARCLRLDPKRPLSVLRLLDGDRVRDVDVVRAEGPGWQRHYVCVAGAGFDSGANEVANRSRLPGTARYLAAVLRTLRSFRPAEFVVHVDGEERRLAAMMVAVGNAPSYGGGMRVCPGASPWDGLLDVSVVGEMSRPRFLASFPRVYRGTHVTMPEVTVLRGAKVEVEASRPFVVYGDGEPMGPLPVTLGVVPAGMRVVAP